MILQIMAFLPLSCVSAQRLTAVCTLWALLNNLGDGWSHRRGHPYAHLHRRLAPGAQTRPPYQWRPPERDRISRALQHDCPGVEKAEAAESGTRNLPQR